MAGKLRDPELVRRAAELYAKFPSVNVVARKMGGISSTSVIRYLNDAGVERTGNSGRRAGLAAEKAEPSAVELPDFPAEDVSTDELIALQCRRYTTRKASHAAHTWFPVKVREDRPIGILWFGDPHVDDNGCNWPLLRKHTEFCRTTDGLYGANIGDTTNNWVGNLMRLYANQEASQKTARRFAKWFMLESGVRWLIWLLGNHDQWNDGAEILAQMAKQHGTQKVICHDWEARFRLVFPNGAECKVFAAHDHPGNSMWNPLHGQVKAAKFGNGIDLIIAGHRHNWGISQWEMPEQDATPLMVRLRGYKHMDDHARRLGIQEQEEGQGVLTIINPLAANRAGRVLAFADVESGVDFLKFLRRKHRG